MNYNTPIIGIGDVLLRPKYFGLVQHRGIFLGGNAVLTNTPDKGEHLATIEEFSGREHVTVYRTGANPREVIARSREILKRPRKYDPISRNCEHTASEVTSGRAKSPTVAFWGIMAIVGLAYVLTRR